ncbi:ArsR/SmtB family transcription factor [Natronorubrum sp. A-ect3]|uniref:ArsR/SmtB family transcription factor n=1 Tax=Natronorubrum sp. A-ect3 TaxID=3242698 RepID=UPI00359E3325
MSLLEVLGNTRRLKIIRELSREPKYVSELAETVGMDGKSAVHHLTALEEAGLVEHYQRGNRKYYRLIKDIELYAAPPPERSFILQASDLSDDRT